jgi:hypothetical protein
MLLCPPEERNTCLHMAEGRRAREQSFNLEPFYKGIHPIHGDGSLMSLFSPKGHTF